MKPAILGGDPLRKEHFPLRRTMGLKELQEVQKVIESDDLSAFLGGPGKFFNGGHYVKEFEKKWAEQYGFKHAISVNSWTNGLLAAIGAVGVEPGDEVICSPYTMSASATCALFYGGIPVFADIDPNTYCISAETIAPKITKRTKAIVVVHLFGGCADMDPIMELANKHNIKVIEDAAQAPGIHYKGRPIGTIGHIGGFSLNLHKHIQTGEGGMLVTNDPELDLRCRLIRNHGENSIDALGIKNIANVIGANHRMTELQAAVGIHQLDKLNDLIQWRNRLAKHLTSQLNQIEGMDADQNLGNGDNAYYLYPFKYIAEKAGMPRNLFVKSVLAELPEAPGFESIPLTEGYIKPLYLNQVYQQQIAIGTKGFPFTMNPDVDYDYSKGICPVTENLFEHELLLCPVLREPLEEQDVDDIVKAIQKVLDHKDMINKNTDKIKNREEVNSNKSSNFKNVR